MPGPDVPDTHRWDSFYAGEEGDRPRWSGRPNGSLVGEVEDLPPGTALDVGCGEGADAIWLAQRGWQVTAVDPSGVALERAEVAAREVGVDVRWVRAGLTEVPGGAGQHDLVSAQYAVLSRTEGDAAVGALLDAVAPGGTLLVVHHLLDAGHAGHGGEHGFDPADHLTPGRVLPHLRDRWTVEVHATRPRPGDHHSGARHVDDVVLRAVRRRRRSEPVGGSTGDDVTDGAAVTMDDTHGSGEGEAVAAPTSRGAEGRVRTLARWALGGFLTFAGLAHLTVGREEFAAQVPDWVPASTDAVVVGSGVIEIALGLALLSGRNRTQVGWVTAAFLVAIFPGNVAQYVEGTDAFGLDTDRARFIRLFFQPILIAWALWSTGAWRAWRDRGDRPAG